MAKPTKIPKIGKPTTSESRRSIKNISTASIQQPKAVQEPKGDFEKAKGAFSKTLAKVRDGTPSGRRGAYIVDDVSKPIKKLKKTDQRYNLNKILIRQGLALTKWPGRLEHVMETPLVILDGAHNLQAARVLGKHLSSTLKNKKLTLVLGILDDKPYEKMLESLVPCAQNKIITKAKIDRSLEPSVLKKAAQRFTNCPITIIEDVKEAVTHAINTSNDEDAVCIAGSLYVAGEAKEKLDNDLDH